MEWLNTDQIKIDPPKKPKKITGTRLASILGYNKWSTPFATWCAITRTYEDPFVDNKYTIAGKVIEPKLIDYVSKRYFLDAQTPTDVFGGNYFNKTFGDFFHEDTIFGGMWDAIAEDTIIEIKTTKRAEDWVEDIPEYYKLQAALYAYLKGANRVIFCCGFLTDKDYETPEDYKPVIGKNVTTIAFNMDEEYPNFLEEYIKPATLWWDQYVSTGISPAYDEKKDAEILKALRNLSINNDNDLDETVAHIDELLMQEQKIKKQLKPISDELKKEQDKLKAYMMDALKSDPTKNTAEVKSANRCFTLTKSVSNKVDEKALKEAGLFEKYSKESVSYTLRNKIIK